MAITEEEGFEAVPDGTAISTSNTTFDTIGGTAADMVGDTSDPLHGQVSALVDPTNGVSGVWNSWPGYGRGYVRLDTVPGANTWFAIVRAGGTNKVEFRFHAGSATMQIRDGFTAVDQSTQTFGAGDVVRFEWEVTATAQTVRLFYGPNLEGDTPDETLSGTADGATADAPDEIAFGAPTSGDGLYTMDSVAIGDDWIGPAEQVFDAEWVFFDGASETLVEAFEWDGVTETPLETIVVQ